MRQIQFDTRISHFLGFMTVAYSQIQFEFHCYGYLLLTWWFKIIIVFMGAKRNLRLYIEISEYETEQDSRMKKAELIFVPELNFFFCVMFKAWWYQMKLFYYDPGSCTRRVTLVKGKRAEHTHGWKQNDNDVIRMWVEWYECDKGIHSTGRCILIQMYLFDWIIVLYLYHNRKFKPFNKEACIYKIYLNLFINHFIAQFKFRMTGK